MTTKQYIQKYNLDKTDKFSHNEFVQDLSSDFIALLELNKANDNLKGFENSVRCIRMKFDAIANKTLGVFPEKLWGYFFAKVVAPLREELCPKDMQKRKQMQEEKRKQREQRRAHRNWEFEQFNDFIFGAASDFFSFLFEQMKAIKPTQHFANLGLPDTANEQEVVSAYRKLSNIHHPDKGGKQDKFIEITDSKNKCLHYLKTSL